MRTLPERPWICVSFWFSNSDRTASEYWPLYFTSPPSHWPLISHPFLHHRERERERVRTVPGIRRCRSKTRPTGLGGRRRNSRNCVWVVVVFVIMDVGRGRRRRWRGRAWGVVLKKGGAGIALVEGWRVESAFGWGLGIYARNAGNKSCSGLDGEGVYLDAILFLFVVWGKKWKGCEMVMERRYLGLTWVG